MNLFRKSLWTISLLSVLVLFCQSVSAQGTLDQLIDADTTTVTRINIERADVSKLAKNASTLAIALVDMTVVSQEDRDQAKSAMPMLVGMMISQFAPVFDTLKTNGVKELFLISNSKDESVSSSYFAIPLTGQTPEQVAALRALAKNESLSGMKIRYPFERHGFVIAPLATEDASDDQVKAYIKQYFKELAPVANPVFADGLALYPDAAICFVAEVKGQDVSEEEIADAVSNLDLSSFPGGDAISQENLDQYKDTIARFAKEFATRLSSVVQGIGFDDLSWSLSLKLRSDSDLDAIKKCLADAADETISQAKAKQNADSAPLTESLMKALTPNYGTDTVSWTIDKKFCNDHQDLLNQIFEKVGQETADEAPFGDDATDDSVDDSDSDFDISFESEK